MWMKTTAAMSPWSNTQSGGKKSSPLLKQSCEFRRMLSVSLSSSCRCVFPASCFCFVTVTSVYHGPRCSLCVVKPPSVMLPDFSYFLFHFGNLCPVYLVFCFTFPVFSSLDAVVFPVTWCVFIVSVSRLSFVMPSLDGCVFPYFTVPWDFYVFFASDQPLLVFLSFWKLSVKAVLWADVLSQVVHLCPHPAWHTRILTLRLASASVKVHDSTSRLNKDGLFVSVTRKKPLLSIKQHSLALYCVTV